MSLDDLLEEALGRTLLSILRMLGPVEVAATEVRHACCFGCTCAVRERVRLIEHVDLWRRHAVLVLEEKEPSGSRSWKEPWLSKWKESWKGDGVYKDEV